MVKVTISQQYEGSRAQDIVNFYSVLFQPDLQKVLEMVTEDVVYVTHGVIQYDGQSGIEQMLKDMGESGIRELKVDTIVSTDNYAAAKGSLQLEDDTEMAFCEFLTLGSDGRISRVDSYVVALSGTVD